MIAYFKKNKLLFFIILFALIVRVVGVFPGHPSNHPDEPMSFGSAIEMLVHNDLNPRRFDYPSGVPLIHYLFFQIFVMPFLYFRIFLSSPSVMVDSLLSRTNLLVTNPNMVIGYNGIFLLFASRFLTAVMGALSVFFVYKIGEKLFNRHVGLLSAFFLAFNYRHDLSSHLALSDIPNSFFVVLSFFSCVLLLEKNTLKRYILAGLLIGLSVSMKYQAFAVFPLLLTQLSLIVKKRTIKELFNKNFIISLLIIPAVFVVLNPYLFLNLKIALPVIEIVSRRYGIGINKFNYYALFNLYKWGIGQLPFILIAAGMILMLIKNTTKAIFLFSYVGVFLYIFLYYITGGGYVRNFTTVIPLLMIFAGYGSYQFLHLFKRFNLNRKTFFILSAFLLISVNFSSIKNSVILSIEYSKPWSQSVVDGWADKNIAENSRIRNGPLGISSHTIKQFDLYAWQHSHENSIAEFSEAKDDFAVLDPSWYQIYMFWFDIPFKELLRYMDIPYKKLKNTYYALSLSEFMNYSVFETHKSWQAPEDGYIVIKVPAFPKNLGKKIKEFHFDKDMEGWKFYDFSGQNVIEKVNWSNEGNDKAGSIEMTGNVVNSDFSRLISPFIKINPGKTYVVEGYGNNLSEVRDDWRDGFFRIDIYQDKDKSMLYRDSLGVAVSGRIYGVPHWNKKKVLIKAPKNANYMTISFQRTLIDAQIKYLLDDITVYEIENVPWERFPNIPYKKPSVPDSVIFPIGIY